MGGGLDPNTLGDEDAPTYPSEFAPGGGTFRPVGEPRIEHPVLREIPGQGARDPGGLTPMSPESGEYQKKIYDYEALRRMLELLNQERAQKPYGVPDNSNIGF
jgi:hypothetical protein